MCMFKCVGPQRTRPARCRSPNRPRAETQPSGATPSSRLQHKLGADQLALASSLIQDTLERLQRAVLTLTFPCESGGGMETVWAAACEEHSCMFRERLSLGKTTHDLPALVFTNALA